MMFTFYVVDESKMPSASAEGSEAVNFKAVKKAIRENGGRWDQVEADIEEFAACFQVLGQFTATEDFLTNLAFAGSPNFALVGCQDDWTLGYFEAGIVPHLLGVINQLDEAIIAAIDAKGEDCRSTFEAFRDALEEAHSLGFAVAIIHD